MKRGDLAAAGGIAVDALKLAWLKAKPEVDAILQDLGAKLGGIWDRLVLDIKEAWKGVHTSIQESLAEVKKIIDTIMPVIEFAKSMRDNGVDILDIRNSDWWSLLPGLPSLSDATAELIDRLSGRSKPTLTPDMMDRSRHADELRREAIRRGMTEQQADAIARGVMTGPAAILGNAPPPMTDPAGAAAVAELERRRREGIEVKPFRPGMGNPWRMPLGEVQEKFTDEQAKALDTVLSTAGDVLTDAAKKWAALRDGVAKRIPDAQNILKAEEDLRKRLADEALDSVLNKAGKAWADIRNGINGMIPSANDFNRGRLALAGEELSSTVKGLFQAGDARMSLGIGDKVIVDATKSTAKNTAATAKKAEEMADTLVDIRSDLKDMNKWA